MSRAETNFMLGNAGAAVSPGRAPAVQASISNAAEQKTKATAKHPASITPLSLPSASADGMRFWVQRGGVFAPVKKATTALTLKGKKRYHISLTDSSDDETDARKEKKMKKKEYEYEKSVKQHLVKTID